MGISKGYCKINANYNYYLLLFILGMLSTRCLRVFSYNYLELESDRIN
jgi:hypothetical protein